MNGGACTLGRVEAVKHSTQ